jgi:L-aminopeptidase/D-esterase-like protein
MAPAITDVPGVQVGHAQDAEAMTGCTVVLTVDGAVGGVDVRGGAPGTRETDLLAPTAEVAVVHAITLCGGSAFGLAAATGVVGWLRERDIGYATPFGKVPIVPAAVIYDLGCGRSDRWPDAALGYAACAAAELAVAEGCIGAGTGASVGKLLGMGGAVKSGIGTWSETLADGSVVGALVVCNAWGDVYDEASGQIIAGTRDPQSGRTVDSMALLRQPQYQSAMQVGPAGAHTTLAVVATDARLTKAEATKLARMAQAALPRTIRPVHTPFDGDMVFALATGRRAGPHITIVGAVAADVLARAIERSVRMATSAAGLPAARDLTRD